MRLALVFALVSGCGSDLPPVDQCVIEQWVDGELVARSVEQLDAEGRPVSIVARVFRARPPNRAVTHGFEYDGEGRLIAVSAAFGSAEARQEALYEADRILVTNSAGFIEYTLDGGRIVAELADVLGRPLHEVRYAYDERGRLVERADVWAGASDPQSVSRVLAFDGVGRAVLGELDGTRFAWSYTDTPAGLVVTRTISGGATVARLQTDATGRLLGAALDDNTDGTFEWVASYAYDDDARTMSAVAVDTRLGPASEWRFVARGTCPAIRLPESGLRGPNPLPAAQGRVDIVAPGLELFVF